MKAKPMGVRRMMLAGRISRYQQDATGCRQEENEILREKPGTRRILHTLAQIQDPYLR